MWLPIAAAVTSRATLYTGAGGCDVSDAECVQPSPPLSQQILALSATGRLVQNVTTPGGPSWVHMSNDGKCLFAALSNVSKVASFAVDAQSGTLSAVSVAPSGGVAPVKLDLTPPVLVVANYGKPTGGASVGSLLVGADCGLTPADAVAYNRSSIDPRRQRSSHVHTVVVDPAAPTRIYAADLGGDAVYTLTVSLATGKLTRVGMAVAAPGSGPRHLAVHPAKRVLYVLHEMANQLTALAISPAGDLSPLGPPISTLPPNASIGSCVGLSDIGGGGEAVEARETPCSKAAEVVVTRDGTAVFASNRGYGTPLTNTVAGFGVAAENGKLQPSTMTLVATGTRYPRGMALVSNGADGADELVVAGQGSGNLVALAIGPGAQLRLRAELAHGLPAPTTVGAAGQLTA